MIQWMEAGRHGRRGARAPYHVVSASRHVFARVASRRPGTGATIASATAWTMAYVTHEDV